jgi:Tol biopolymer transport system component
MKPDVSDVRRVGATGSDDNAAYWSPDNKKIAFASDRDGNGDVYVMDANGNNASRLTNTRAIDRAPVWSPDGKRIAFSSDGDGPSEVYVINADGSNHYHRRSAARLRIPAGAETDRTHYYNCGRGRKPG